MKVRFRDSPANVQADRAGAFGVRSVPAEMRHAGDIVQACPGGGPVNLKTGLSSTVLGAKD